MILHGRGPSAYSGIGGGSGSGNGGGSGSGSGSSSGSGKGSDLTNCMRFFADCGASTIME